MPGSQRLEKCIISMLVVYRYINAFQFSCRLLVLFAPQFRLLFNGGERRLFYPKLTAVIQLFLIKFGAYIFARGGYDNLITLYKAIVWALTD